MTDEVDTIGALAEERRAALWERRLSLERSIMSVRAAQGGDSFRERLLAGAVTAVLKGVGLYGRGVANAHRPVVRHRVARLAAWPRALDGFRILHLGDFHFDGSADLPHRIAEVLGPVEAELCVFTGDSLYLAETPVDAVGAGLRIALGSKHFACGRWASMGNNDYSWLMDEVASAGFQWLVNDHVVIEHEEERFVLAGVDDPHKFRSDDLEMAFLGTPSGAPRVLLAHSPDIADGAARANVDLYLAGHTHGGQLCAPGGWALYRNGYFPLSRVRGLWRVGEMTGHTTAGLGCTAVPLRYNCAPEAVVVELRGAGR